MIVRCTHCDAAYAVDDKKIENKKFGFSCPKCGTNVIIDNRIHADGDSGAFDFGEESPAPAAGKRTAVMPPEDDFIVEPPSARGAQAPVKDDLAFESDMLDRDLGDVIGDEDAPSRTATPADASGDEFDFIDEPRQKKSAKPKSGPAEQELDDEPLSLEDFASGIEEAPAKGAKEKSADAFDDILFDEDERVPAGVSAEPRARKGGEAAAADDDLNLDDIVTYSTPAAKTKGAKAKTDLDEFELQEDITLDDEIKTDEIFSREPTKKPSSDMDESITIDLDTLDIELEEEPGGKAVYKEAGPGEDFLMDEDFLKDAPGKKTVRLDEDESTTIDLDSLDITLEEEEELKKGVELDEDERLTLDDTGLSIDDLSEQELKSTLEDDLPLDLIEDEDIKLNLKEIDPSLSIDDLTRPEGAGSRLVTDEFESEKLPEIDIDRLEQEDFTIAHRPLRTRTGITAAAPDSILDIENERTGPVYDIEHPETAVEVHDTVPGGAVNFSIDHSLGYSRIGALLRLFCLYYIALIPHFIVLFIYTLLTMILGAVNTWITLFGGRWQEDFAEIQEKTLRYMISLGACAADVVEEMPPYAGKSSIDYPLQLNVIFPARNSRWMALLRATGVGMLVVALPHLLLLFLLSLGAVLISFAGLISLIATRSWPHILFNFMASYYNYAANVLAFLGGIVDRYPSFRVE
ncbi:MAG: DUF4389 domain-containing protein [Spirochaetes bacterium]|nr:MAG: DUF4389 domain-containing protein [Spirochaetota bacterium]